MKLAVDISIGVLVCASLAAFAAVVAYNAQLRDLLPFGFVVLVIAVSQRYGAVSAILGCLAAALIFSYFLYHPLGSLRVESAQARSNLGWLLILGSALSFLLAPPWPEQRVHARAPKARPEHRDT